jgi:hypothetical protein
MGLPALAGMGLSSGCLEVHRGGRQGVLSSSVAFAAIDAFLLGALGAVVTAPFAATLLPLLGWRAPCRRLSHRLLRM